MSRHSVLIAVFCVAAVAACDTASQLAAVGNTTTTSDSTLAITPSSAQVTVGAQTQLTTNAPATLQNQVQWRSSQPTVAAVNTTGLVTGVAAGTAVITARYAFDTTKAATATITVVGATGTGTRIP